MMKRLKLLMIVLLALWLPVQGYGAVAMPFCAHGAGNTAVAAAGSGGAHSGHDGYASDDAHDAHPGHDAAPEGSHSTGHLASTHDGDTHSAGNEGSNLACNDCGACQLACSPILFAPAPALFAASAAVFDQQPVAPLLSITPERLQRPPLSALA